MARRAHVILVAATMLACAQAPPDAPDYELDMTSRPPNASDKADPSDKPPATPNGAKDPGSTPTTTTTTTTTTTPPSDVAYKGTLAKTTVVNYGGSIPYCKWSMTLTNVEAVLTADAAGNVKTATVKARMTETTPSCPTAPIPSNVHTYTFGTETPSTSLALALTPAPTNKPLADLSLQGTRAEDGKTMTARLRWHRTDRDAPFDWTVVADVVLKPSPSP